MLGEHPDVVDDVGEERGHDPPVAASARRGPRRRRAGRSAPNGPPHWSQMAAPVERAAAARAESRVGRSRDPHEGQRKAVRPWVGQEMVSTGRRPPAARTLIRAATVWATPVSAGAAGPGLALGDGRHAGVAALADLDVERDAAEVLEPVRGGEALAAAAAEDLGRLAAVRADEGASCSRRCP